MTDNLITWNVRNWITVFLMFLAGWAVISLGVRLLRGNGALSTGTDGQLHAASGGAGSM